MEAISIKLNGEREVIGFFDRYDQAVATQINEALDRAGRNIQSSAQARAPKGRSGRLRRSIALWKRSDGSGVNIRVRARHGAIMEFGSGPKGASMNRADLPNWFKHRIPYPFPNVKRLKSWARSKEIEPFLVARSIFRRQGLAPRPYLYPAFEMEREAVIADIQTILSSSAVEEAKQ